ncbi:MAG: hypothetical protein AAB958_01595, partial [Patescibacteria group bacterium]
MVYAITYDLNKPGQNYPSLYSTIKRLGHWIWPLQNLWFIDSENGAQEIANEIHTVIDQNDSVFVVRVYRGQWGSWMSSETNQWIN